MTENLLPQMIICGTLPAIALLFYIRYRDRKQPEPWLQILKGVFLGVLSVILTVFFNEFVWEPLPFVFNIESIYAMPFVGGVFEAFYNAAIPEESFKLLMLWLLVRRNKYFDERLDGIVYAVCVGLGFAALENIMYLIINEAEWQSVAISRAIFSVPGHYMFAVVMGFYYSLVHFYPTRFRRYRYLVWLAPVLVHGIYDSICFTAVNIGEEMGGIISLLLIAFCIYMHRRSLRYISRLEE